MQAQVLNLLLELQGEMGVAYLFITHDLSVVRHMSTRIAVLERGHLLETGEATQITEHLTRPYTRRLIAASPQADPDVQDARRAVRRLTADLRSGGSAPSPDAVRDILRALERQAITEVLSQRTPNTEILDRAIDRFRHEPANLTRAIDVRAAIPELAPRRSAEMLSEALTAVLTDAQRQLCAAAIVEGRNELVARCEALAAAINSGDGIQAHALVSTLNPGGILNPSSQRW